jgi:hypothetical protein
MKNLLMLFLLHVMTFMQVLCQEPCSTQDIYKEHVREFPGIMNYAREYLSNLTSSIRNFPFNPELHRSPVTIPVVVHVLYNTHDENISEEQINAQINVLNADFRKRNQDVNNLSIPPSFRNRAADCYIQFRLASRAPDGSTTTGITRKQVGMTIFTPSGEAMKGRLTGVEAWDPDKYLNIWVCRLDSLAGYATFPWDSVKWRQGVVISNRCFGVNAPYNRVAYNMGRTTTHETGHFFGLYHIWGDGDGCSEKDAKVNCACGFDDQVDDTPNQGRANYGRPPIHSTCSNGPDGDMFMNFMDYVDDTVMCLFTNGQRNRMLASLAPGGRRAGLAVSNAIFPANAPTISYQVNLQGQNRDLPAWKAALSMIHGWACGCIPNTASLTRDNGPACNSARLKGLPGEISDFICALALTPQELRSCFSIGSFYSILSTGPVALVSVNTTDYYGLVISGMVMDPVSGRAVLQIKDPKEIGPQYFGITQRGSEYNVEYSQFMTEILDNLIQDGTHVYIVYPPVSLTEN